MNDTSLLNELNLMIDHYVSRNGSKPSRVILGYKAYSTLMNDREFAKEVTNSTFRSQ